MKLAPIASIFFALVIFASSQEEISQAVVNGENAAIEDFPHMAHIFTTIFPTCGGAILSQRTVLTAAHCLETLISQPILVSVVVGTANRNGRGGQTYRTSRILLHPSYTSGPAFFFDVAVVRTISRIQFTPLVQPIPIAGPERIGVGAPGVFAGWGVYRYGPIIGRLPDTLQKMNTTTIANDDCRERFSVTDRAIFIVDQKLCIVSGPRTSICGGDSGGPLVIDGTVAGVISWRTFPCGDGLPDVFIRISDVRDWIVSVLV